LRLRPWQRRQFVGAQETVQVAQECNIPRCAGTQRDAALAQAGRCRQNVAGWKSRQRRQPGIS